MTDYSELKRLAEAATPDPWVWDGNGNLNAPTIPAPGAVLRYEPGEGMWFGCYSSVGEDEANQAWIAAANPSAVLVLIAENEALRVDAEKWKIVQHAMDKLQADERDGSIWSVCARLLISTAHKLNSAISTVTEEGVTISEEEIGDWRVTVERINVSKEG